MFGADVCFWINFFLECVTHHDGFHEHTLRESEPETSPTRLRYTPTWIRAPRQPVRVRLIRKHAAWSPGRTGRSQLRVITRFIRYHGITRTVLWGYTLLTSQERTFNWKRAEEELRRHTQSDLHHFLSHSVPTDPHTSHAAIKFCPVCPSAFLIWSSLPAFLSLYRDPCFFRCVLKFLCKIHTLNRMSRISDLWPKY